MKRVKTVTAAVVLGSALLVLGGCGQSAAPAATASAGQAGQSASELKLYQGMGQTPVFRVRVDKATNKKLYSINYVQSSAIFDGDGKIVDVQFDILEIVPESEKEGSTVLTGWPTDDASEAAVKKEVADWKTKRERGDEAYGLNWSEQANFYAEQMKGKTVAEVEQWFAKNFSDVNGKPLSEKSTDADKAKYDKLTDAEKEALADVTSGASISLKDAHGDFIGALKEAFANKKEVTLK